MSKLEKCNLIEESSFTTLDNIIKNTHMNIQEKIKELPENNEPSAFWISIGKLAGILNNEGKHKGTTEELTEAYNRLILHWNDYVDQPISYNKQSWWEFIQKKYL